MSDDGTAPDGTHLLDVAFEDLLKNAEVVSFDELAMGVATAKRVHLKKAEVELRAVWRPFPPSGDGAQRSYRAEIAAYELDKMLGLNMVPPIVERIIEGLPGANATFGIQRDKRACHRRSGSGCGRLRA